MQYQIIHPNKTRYAKREKGIRERAETKNSDEIAKVIGDLEEQLKGDRDEDSPEYPALMINTILWDAMVEALEIWKMIQAERS